VLEEPTSWVPMTNGISVSGENYIVTNSPGAPAAFYRLLSQ
jgi:hypothetical protein